MAAFLPSLLPKPWAAGGERCEEHLCRAKHAVAAEGSAHPSAQSSLPVPSTAPQTVVTPSPGHGAVAHCSNEQSPEQDGFRRTLAEGSPTASLYTCHLSEVVNTPPTTLFLQRNSQEEPHKGRNNENLSHLWISFSFQGLKRAGKGFRRSHGLNAFHQEDKYLL